MRSKGRKMSKRTLALLAAALLMATGGILGTRAQINVFSGNYNAQVATDHLQVHLMENGRDVCGEKNTVEGTKTTGDLVTYLGYSAGKPGQIKPGRTYREEIAAKNGQDTAQYARILIRKYWKDVDGNKTQKLKPSMIRLMYDGKPYNTSAWQKNEKESTDQKGGETSVYYYSTQLAPNAVSEQLFNQLRIDEAVFDVENMKPSEEEKDGKKITTYTYNYDGYTLYIEADVQAVQTHHANEAIEGIWGAENVSVSDGSLTVE